MTPMTEFPLPPKTAKGFCGSWSERPVRRSSSSTAAAGVTGPSALFWARPTRPKMKIMGTMTMNSISPTKTPAMVRRNCFIDIPNRSTPARPEFEPLRHA